jgi:hypothetical protein
MQCHGHSAAHQSDGRPRESIAAILTLPELDAVPLTTAVVLRQEVPERSGDDRRGRRRGDRIALRRPSAAPRVFGLEVSPLGSSRGPCRAVRRGEPRTLSELAHPQKSPSIEGLPGPLDLLRHFLLVNHCGGLRHRLRPDRGARAGAAFVPAGAPAACGPPCPERWGGPVSSRGGGRRQGRVGPGGSGDGGSRARGEGARILRIPRAGGGRLASGLPDRGWVPSRSGEPCSGRAAGRTLPSCPAP